jgi:hypothetical protein
MAREITVKFRHAIPICSLAIDCAGCLLADTETHCTLGNRHPDSQRYSDSRDCYFHTNFDIYHHPHTNRYRYPNDFPDTYYHAYPNL